MASVALLLLLVAAADHVVADHIVADHGLLDLSYRRLTTIEVVNVSVDAASLTVNLSRNAITSWGARPFLDLRNVTVLDLSHNRLTSVDGAALADVPDVRELNLSDNALVNLAGRPFRALLNLVHLDLSNNNIETLNGSSLGDLVRLQRLSLRQNKLVVLDDADLRGLAKLQWFDVSDNNIASVAAGAFRGFNGLDELVADHNTNLGSLVIVGRRLQKVSLQGSGLTAVPASLTRSVRTLILRENRLKGVRCGDLDSYPLLRELDLSLNDIETIEDDALGRLEQLTVLRLSFNQKLRVVPPGLPAGLISLELVGNHIEAVSASDFQGLRHLRELNLSGNPLSELSVGSFRPLEALETLDLSANVLETLHADVLEGLPRLQVLRLTGLRHLVRPASWLPFPVAPERLTFLDVSNSPVLADQLLADTAALTAMRQLTELRMESDGLSTLRQDLSSLVGRLRRIRLRDNPLNCNASATSWLQSWATPLDIDDALCASPEELRGRALSSLRSAFGSPEAGIKDTTKLESNLTTTPVVSTQTSPLIITTPSTITTLLSVSTPELSSSEQVLHHTTTIVAGNLTTQTPVSLSSTTHNTTPPTQFSAPSNSSNYALTTPKANIDPTRSKDEKSKHSSPAGNKPVSTEAQSQSSRDLLPSTPVSDKHSQVSQETTQTAKTTVSSLSPSRPTNSVRTEAVDAPTSASRQHAVATDEPISTTRIVETTARTLPPSREALRAERPASNTSSLLAMFGVGAVGSALVLLVIAAAQAAPRPRLDISSFNNLRKETKEEDDDTRAELW